MNRFLVQLIATVMCHLKITYRYLTKIANLVSKVGTKNKNSSSSLVFGRLQIFQCSSKHSFNEIQPMETVLRKTRESTGVNCRNVRRRVRCQ